MDNSSNTANQGQEEISAKIIVVGSVATGKSSIMLRFIENKFSLSHEATIGVDFCTKVIEASNNWKIRLNIMDTAGQEEFQSVARSYYRESAAALIVFDVTDRRSFQQISKWLNAIRENSQNKQIVVLLIANKIDSPNREVSTEEGELYARERSLMYFEVSAKRGDNIDAAFSALVNALVRKLDQGLISFEDSSNGIRKVNNASNGDKKKVIVISSNDGSRNPLLGFCCNS